MDTVSTTSTLDSETGVEKQVSRVKAYTPFKKPKAQELTDQQKEFNRALASIRIRIEHCIGWIKNWAIIATRFRCSHSIYGLVMQTICGPVNQQTLRRQRATGVSTYCA
ncbi:MAG: transposase [Methylococcales bacterium]|nr:transposase [Methylococcales bacterium]